MGASRTPFVCIGTPGEDITYAWTATGLTTVTHTGRGATDSVAFNWTTPGIKTIVVTATGMDSPASATRSVLVNTCLFLPLVRK